MTKSELIDKISSNQEQLPPRDVEMAVRMILDRMVASLSNNARCSVMKTETSKSSDLDPLIVR